MLGTNLELSKKILLSAKKKLKVDKIKMIDDVRKEQERRGIIQRVANLNEFLQLHREVSFSASYFGL